MYLSFDGYSVLLLNTKIKWTLKVLVYCAAVGGQVFN